MKGLGYNPMQSKRIVQLLAAHIPDDTARRRSRVKRLGEARLRRILLIGRRNKDYH